MTSEIVWAPVANLRFVAAGNLGADYAVTPFDPAVRRRFDIILEFDYLELDAEKKLVVERTGLDATVAHAVCLLAQRTREMRRNADLPGCIDTGSVLTWARLCAARKAATLADMLAIGKLVWADVACGRDHLAPGQCRQVRRAGRLSAQGQPEAAAGRSGQAEQLDLLRRPP